MSYLNDIKKSYPTCDQKFVDDVCSMLEEVSHDSAHSLVGKWMRSEPINKRLFYIVRTRLAEWKYNKWLDFVTSPKSDAYWQS